MEKCVVCMVDDVKWDLERYARLLESTGVVDVRRMRPPTPFNVESLVELRPDLFLVDYLLTEPNGEEERANYLGSTLASGLREHVKEHPIVVLTRKVLSHWKEDEEFLDRRQIFDGVVFKGDIERDPADVAKKLRLIAEGFAELREAGRTWEGLLSLLRVQSEVEEGLLRKAIPPLSIPEEEGHDAGVRWQVSEVARWIQRVIIGYPGILYDKVHAATLLGIDEDSFQKEAVQEFFAEARYAGSFAPPEGRWWKNRLIGRAKALLVDRGFSGPVNRLFREVFAADRGVGLEVARCVYREEEFPADWVCCILRKPVMFKYSVAYRMDQRPAVMDESRVSFKAIIERNDVYEERVDRAALELFRELRRGGGRREP